MEEIKKELIIIGSGPAGIGAAIYAYRAGIDFSITDKYVSGGQIINTEYIENYPGFYQDVSGFELMDNMKKHLDKFEVSIDEFCEITEVLQNKFSKEKSLKSKGKNFICKSENKIFYSVSVILATGASPSKLGKEGEDALIGRGVSFCATCDAALYRDKTVAVVGGGNAAIEEAIFLTKFAKKVYIIHRRDELRASKLIQERAFANKKLEFLLSTEILKFSGSEKLEKLFLNNNKTNKTSELSLDGVFEYVGLLPNTEAFKNLIDTDKNGFVITDENMAASLKGIFAAGDVRKTPLRQVITAVSDGALAATSVEKYLAQR